MLKRQRLECSHCHGQMVTGHVIAWFVDDQSGESFLVHGHCIHAFTASRAQQEDQPVTHDNQ